MRHSPLTQIHRGNVRALQVAWTFRTGELATYAGTRFPVDKVAFEATPIDVWRPPRAQARDLGSIRGLM